MTLTQPTLDRAAVDAFAAALRGDLVRVGDDAYEDARKLYNAMIDKRPALIARCLDVADVMAAVAFARDAGLPLAVRGGGHHGGGLGSVDDGLVIDLAAMNGVRVDPEARTVRVEEGTTWGKVDHAAHAFGLAVPSGIISTTGVGGLTLGGGLGHLTRRHCLTIDNLLEVDLVLADGRMVTANAHENQDLYWAVRGGGGNFGVVTSFLFRAHPVDTIVGGPTLWSLDDATDVLRWYRDFIREAPRDLNGFFAFMIVPPGPPFPEDLHGRKVCGVVWCYAGPPERTDEVFAPIAAFGEPLLHGVHPMPIPALQSAFDGLYPPGHQWYWRADFFDELSDEAIAAHVEHAADLPTMQSGMHLYPIDGAAHDVSSDETPWSYRSANWAQVIAGVDPDPAKAGLLSEWAKGYWEALHPYSAGGAYVNMMMDEGQERVRAAYGDNYPRLARIKARYDPDNLFRVNQNIVPEGHG
jgi:hypothetical protein